MSHLIELRFQICWKQFFQNELIINNFFRKSLITPEKRAIWIQESNYLLQIEYRKKPKMQNFQHYWTFFYILLFLLWFLISSLDKSRPENWQYMIDYQFPGLKLHMFTPLLRTNVRSKYLFFIFHSFTKRHMWAKDIKSNINRNSKVVLSRKIQS